MSVNNEQGQNPENPDTEAPEKTNQYYFEMAIKTKGIVSSAIADADELRKTMMDDFTSVYGEGNTEILVLRPVEEGEVERLEAEAMEGFDELVAELEAEDAVIN